jgi:ABC-type protease/lipase transport system fused ATPase/permease subunit
MNKSTKAKKAKSCPDFIKVLFFASQGGFVDLGQDLPFLPLFVFVLFVFVLFYLIICFLCFLEKK